MDVVPRTKNKHHSTSQLLRIQQPAQNLGLSRTEQTGNIPKIEQFLEIDLFSTRLTIQCTCP